MSYSKLACFVGGALFGSVGIKLLTGRDARKIYVKATAAGLRAKDSVMQTVTMAQEEISDIVAAAKDLNEAEAARETEAEAAAEVVDEAAAEE